MLHKTRGIVLNAIKYSESSLIVRIYTESFGLQSYLVKGARSRKGSMRSSLFQPCTLLDMVVDHRNNIDLQHLREVSVQKPFHSIAADLHKSTVAVFLSEILFRSLKDTGTGEDLFDFIANSLDFFDMQEKGIEYFHLFFLLRLSLYLGFQPQGKPLGESAFFDLREGRFMQGRPEHSDQLSGEVSMAMWKMMTATAGELNNISIPRPIREELLSALLIYFQIHLSGLGHIRSIDVLREVFR